MHWSTFLGYCLGIVLIGLWWMFSGFILMLLWNAVVPTAFGGNEVSYVTAVCMVILLWFVTRVLLYYKK